MKVKVSWFGVDDFESAKKFYGQVLGLQKTFEAQEWGEFAGAEGQESIGIAANPRAGKEPGATVVLDVNDIERERKRLIELLRHTVERLEFLEREATRLERKFLGTVAGALLVAVVAAIPFDALLTRPAAEQFAARDKA